LPTRSSTAFAGETAGPTGLREAARRLESLVEEFDLGLPAGDVAPARTTSDGSPSGSVSLDQLRSLFGDDLADQIVVVKEAPGAEGGDRSGPNRPGGPDSGPRPVIERLLSYAEIERAFAQARGAEPVSQEESDLLLDEREAEAPGPVILSEEIASPEQSQPHGRGTIQRSWIFDEKTTPASGASRERAELEPPPFLLEPPIRLKPAVGAAPAPHPGILRTAYRALVHGQGER